MSPQEHPSKQAGLVLLDVLLGLSIFSLLAFISLGSVSQIRQGGFANGAGAEAQKISAGLEAFYTDNQSLPASATGALAALDERGIRLTTGQSLGGYYFSGGSFQVCVVHKSGGTANTNIDAWAIFDSVTDAVVESGMSKTETVPGFCTGSPGPYGTFSPPSAPAASPTPTPSAVPTQTPTATPTTAPATAPVSVADTFTSSSQAPLDRTETGDQPYQFLNAAPGAWVEQGGFAKNIVDPSASNPMALVDVGSTNATVGGRFGYAPSQSGALYARVVDAQNWIRLRVDYFDCTTNAGTCYALVLETSRNGVLTQQGRRDLGNDGPSDIFLTLNGTSVSTAWIYNPGEGTNIGPAGTVSDFVGTTRHGIGAAASARPVGLGGFDYMSIQVS